MAWGKSTKQRRAMQARSWIRKRLFMDPEGRFLLPNAVFYFSRTPCPFRPSRLFGLGWKRSMNHDGVTL